jgi:C1A family cysteine protease
MGSCVDNALAFLYEFDLMAEGKTAYLPSRLYLYYNVRFIEGSVGTDSGSTVSDGLLAVQRSGMVPETSWPYKDSNLFKRPQAKLYQVGKQNIPKKCSHLNQDRTTLRTCLAGGRPYAAGFPVYESFMSQEVASTGIVPLPDVNTEQLLGGHCVSFVGYNDAENLYWGRNSWGSTWGIGGYFKMPYSLVHDSDFFGDFVGIPTV